jgi:hypothetical protein
MAYIICASIRNFLRSRVSFLIGPNILHFPAVSLLSSNIFRPPVACLIGTDCLANTLYTVAPAIYVGSH